MIKKEQLKVYLLYLIIFLYMLLINFKCGFLSDDYRFVFVWNDFLPTGNDKPIENIADIIESAKNYYSLSGGRIIPHFITFLFVNTDKLVFNFINSAVFVFWGSIIYKYSFGKESKNIFYLAAVYISLFLFIPLFGDNILWISGSINYLWTGTLMLYCIYFCELNFDSKKTSTNAAMLFLVLLSSSTNETTGGMLAIWLTVHLIVKKHKFNLKLFLFYILCTVGECLVLLAPGNLNRAAVIEKSQPFSLLDIDKLLFKYISNTLLHFNYGFCIIFIAVFSMFKSGKIKKCTCIVPLLVASAAGVCALSLTGFYTKRPLFLEIILLITAMWKIIKAALDEINNKLKNKFIFFLVISYFLLILLKTSKYISDTYNAYVFYIGTFAFLLYFANIIYFILSTLKCKSGQIGKKINSDSILKKTKILAAATAIVFWGYSVYDYFETIDHGYTNTELNYEKYKNGEDILILDENDKSLIFPEESYITSTNEYVMKWRSECDKNNIDYPATKGF